MKKFAVLAGALACVLALAGCQTGGKPALEDLPPDYSLEQAKEDGCVVYEDLDITSGQDVWDSFVEQTASGKRASVRLGFYYTLGDPSRYDPEYYESVKDQYPVLYVEDLTFNGTSYTLTWFEDGEKIEKTYACLMRYEGEARPQATFSSYLYYVLTQDDTVTWEDIEHGLFSSQFGDFIDHRKVYSDYIYK